MNPKSAKAEFESFIRQSVSTLSALTPSEGIRLMIDFYLRIRAEDCPLENNGDMLLYQWGTYDWGKGAFFQCDITRQFIEEGFEGDDGMSQLALVFYYHPSEEFQKLEAGDRWCESPNEVLEFEAFIKNNAAYQKVSSAKPAEVEIHYTMI